MSENKEKRTDSVYNDSSIVALRGPDRVRLRPSVIFGSNDIRGAEHAFFEIFANSLDEAHAGHGDRINITVFSDRSIEVEDFGRGMPLDFNPVENTYNWELIFCEPYAGGKMDNTKSKSAYRFSLGTNGLGAFAVQASSEYMEVRSYDGKTERSMSFKKGYPVGELRRRELQRSERRTGTVIRWRSDYEVFTDIAISYEFFSDVIRRQAYINAGVHFELRLEREDGGFDTSSYYYENGISDYLGELVGERTISKPVSWHMEATGRDREDKADYDLVVDYAFRFVPIGGQLHYFHNSSYLTHGGAPDTAVRTAFTFILDKYIRSLGKYNKNESKITFPDIAESLVLITSGYSSEASYENQTKLAVTNSFIGRAMTEYIKKQLEIFLIENPTDGAKIVEQILRNKRSREAADKVKEGVFKSIVKAISNQASEVEKFVDCRTNDKNKKELYIVEGDSALTSCKLGRSAEYQALMPVRGKTLNCMKAGYDKIFKSDIIIDLLKVIGCGVEIDNKKLQEKLGIFKLENLRWSKIIICTDADEDGFQIRTLLLTLFYRLLPTLLKEGRVFIAETPLFEITSKEKTYFAYNEFEKADILRDLEAREVKYTLQRSKGLGENEPEMMWETTMNPATRRLIAVMPDDEAATAEIFDTLLGDNLAGRKRFITENGSKYIKDADY